MAGAVTVNVTGLRELQAKLRAIAETAGDKTARKPVTAALRKAGKVLQEDMQRRVRVKSGTLRENIIVTTKRSRTPGVTTVNVTVRAKAKAYKENSRNRRSGRVGKKYKDLGPLFYARFLELGTSKMPAYPFMRPAFEAHKEELPELFRDELAKAIQDALRG